jgi:hypothetical protein
MAQIPQIPAYAGITGTLATGAPQYFLTDIDTVYASGGAFT